MSKSSISLPFVFRIASHRNTLYVITNFKSFSTTFRCTNKNIIILKQVAILRYVPHHNKHQQYKFCALLDNCFVLTKNAHKTVCHVAHTVTIFSH